MYSYNYREGFRSKTPAIKNAGYDNVTYNSEIRLSFDSSTPNFTPSVQEWGRVAKKWKFNANLKYKSTNEQYRLGRV